MNRTTALFVVFAACRRHEAAPQFQAVATTASEAVAVVPSDTTGAISKAERDATTTMPDASVVSCVVRAFGSLSFPQPEGGIVTVIYPLQFDPAT